MEDGLALMQSCFEKLQTILEAGESQPNSIMTSEEYMSAYSTVYNLTNARTENARIVYDNFCATLRAYLHEKVVPSLRRRHHRGAEELLRELAERWRAYSVIMRWLSHFYSYLDRCYVQLMSNLPSVHESGAMCFRDVVFEGIRGEAAEAVLALAEKERRGDGKADRALVRSAAVDLFVAMGMGDMRYYEEELEAKWVDAAGEYYSRKGASWIEVHSCPEYLKLAEDALREERARVESYLHISSEPKVAERVRQGLLVAHAPRLFENEESGFRALVRDNKTEDLERLFGLYVGTPQQLGLAAELFRQHVAEEVLRLFSHVAEEASSVELIRNLIELHGWYSVKYIESCFKSHTLFQRAFMEAFGQFGNKNFAGRTSAEHIAIFCDEFLRKGGESKRRKTSDDAIEKTFDVIVQLLAYVPDRDLFSEFYRKKLSRRLLFNQSASHDHETGILAKLKHQFGVHFTSKMECMLSDMTMAKENHEGFKKFLKENPEKGVDTSVTVVNKFHWPAYKSLSLVIPVEMARSADAFARYYLTLYPSRRLTWNYSLGSCHIQAGFAAKTIELITSTHQAAVLMLFNTSDTLSYQDIKAELKTEDEDLASLLHSLSCAKHKILRKTPGSNKTVSRDDVFEFNEGFTDAMRRVKIPLPQAVDERKAVVKAVDIDRRLQIDCVIVRIMKARKVLKLQRLVRECIEVLSLMFKPDVRLIKKRIDNLMEREYIERDLEDSSLLKYIA